MNRKMELGILDRDLVGKHAYTAIVEPNVGYIIGRADYGIGGYSPMRHRIFKALDDARKFADELNAAEGLTKEQVLKIVFNTMR